MNLTNEPLEFSNMTETAFNQDVLALRRRVRDSDGKTHPTIQHYIEIRLEDLPLMMNALRRTFGELP